MTLIECGGSLTVYATEEHYSIVQVLDWPKFDDRVYNVCDVMLLSLVMSFINPVRLMETLIWWSSMAYIFGVTPLIQEVGGVVKHGVLRVLSFTQIVLKIVFGKVYMTFMYILATFDRLY
jgi:hypothetical protein